MILFITSWSNNYCFQILILFFKTLNEINPKTAYINAPKIAYIKMTFSTIDSFKKTKRIQKEIEENTTSLFKWLEENGNHYQDGIRNYARQLDMKRVL